jgi:hypothetical protein
VRGDDPGEPVLAPLAHQTDDRLGRFRRAALGAINMRLIENDQCGSPKIAWQMDERFQEEFNESAAIRELEFLQICDGGNLVFKQSPRQQHRMTWVGRKFTAGADQQHVYRLAQTCENSPSLSRTMVWIPARSAMSRRSHDLPPPEFA